MLQWWEAADPTMMQYVFLICFLTGLVLLLLDILLGCFSGVLSLDFGADIDLDLDPAIGSALMPLRPICMLTALTIFGGTGTLLSLVFAISWPDLAVAAAAAILGAVSAYLVNHLVLTPLKSNRADALQAQQLIGQTAEVTVRLRPGQVGEVSVKNERGILNYRAKWYDENETETVEAGATVGIMNISADKGTLYVVPLDVEKWIQRIKN